MTPQLFFQIVKNTHRLTFTSTWQESKMNDKFLIRQRPTQGEMDIIHQVKGLMFSFIYQPDSVIDGPTAKAFMEGWLFGCGLKPDHRLALVLVPPGLNMEEVQENYFLELENASNIDSVSKKFSHLQSFVSGTEE
jgi:hypothetical protein